MTDDMEDRSPRTAGRGSEPDWPSEIRNPNAEGATGWVLYDGECAFCRRWMHRLKGVMDRRGFRLARLQEAWVRERLRLDPRAPLTEMRLLSPDGLAPGGADAVVAIARHIWWGWPLFLFAKLPGALPLLRTGYRWVAARRHCSKWSCGVGQAPNPKLQAPGKDQAPNSKPLPRDVKGVAGRSTSGLDWLPLLLLPAVAFLTREGLPA